MKSILKRPEVKSKLVFLVPQKLSQRLKKLEENAHGSGLEIDLNSPIVDFLERLLTDAEKELMKSKGAQE